MRPCQEIRAQRLGVSRMGRDGPFKPTGQAQDIRRRREKVAKWAFVNRLAAASLLAMPAEAAASAALGLAASSWALARVSAADLAAAIVSASAFWTAATSAAALSAAACAAVAAASACS